MRNKRKSDYFGEISLHKEIVSNISMFPKYLYRQERDWTCSIAVLRSITSSIKDIGSEDDIIEKYDFKMGPNYSKDIKDKGILSSEDFDVLYGCDFKDLDISDLWYLFERGYYIACEWMINYDHWTVILGFVKFDDVEDSMMVYYCPYYDEIRMIRAMEFDSMWCSGEFLKNSVKGDFIAVKQASN